MFYFKKYLFLKTFLILYLKAFGISATISNSVWDWDLYDSVLDPEECQKQLTYIRNNNTGVRNRFIDASWRIPRSILRGNLRDFGNYFQCLEISEENENVHISGKYSTINFPLDQDFEIPTFPTTPDLNITWPPGPDWPWPEFPWPELNPTTPVLTESALRDLEQYERARKSLKYILGADPDPPRARNENATQTTGMVFQLAVCIPKSCTAREALDSVTSNFTTGLNFTEASVRLLNDKPWTAVDTVATVILSIIGLITILSSAYDIRHTILLERDPKKANKIYQSFSIYTNTKKFFTFHDNPSALNCMEGVRSLAMIWVIVGHTFITQIFFVPENPLDAFAFMREFSSLWTTSATITVDTFFTMSGLLVVYTTAAKVSRMSLIKNLHLFYLNRLLRMFPILAFGVLMLSSFLYRTADGPNFERLSGWVEDCRNNWWSTLLYVQNFVNPANMCLPHTWYLAIDMQLHVFSPIVLFFVLGQKKWSAWTAIGGTLVGFVAGSTVYNFINEFQSSTVALSRPEDSDRFMEMYYLHTLPRAAPFFVGMLFGYLLHIYRGKKIKLPILLVLCLWVVALAGLLAVCSATYWAIQPDWDNQLMDNLLNSFKRPVWAACVGWVIFACAKGYGGPINWLLSLHIFKILGRLSYAMYILHYPLIYLINSTTLVPVYFALHFSIHRFFIDISLAIIAAFLVTILIDFPFSNLIKMAIGPGPRKAPVPKEKPSISSGDPEVNFQAVDVIDEDIKNTKINNTMDVSHEVLQNTKSDKTAL